MFIIMFMFTPNMNLKKRCLNAACFPPLYYWTNLKIWPTYLQLRFKLLSQYHVKYVKYVKCKILCSYYIRKCSSLWTLLIRTSIFFFILFENFTNLRTTNIQIIIPILCKRLGNKIRQDTFSAVLLLNDQGLSNSAKHNNSVRL